MTEQAGLHTSRWQQWRPMLVAGVLTVGVLAGIVLLVWLVPPALYGYVTDPQARATAEASTRTGLITGLAGLAALAGLVLLAARNVQANRQTLEAIQQAQNKTLRLTEQGHITDRYTKAIDQLSSTQLDVQLGGIYALERIAVDSARDHPTVVEVFSAYVRQQTGLTRHRRSPLAAVQGEASPQPAADVQAAVTVLGRLPLRQGVSRGHLTGARLAGADLGGANLAGARLSQVDLVDAQLGKADLAGARLDGADLAGAELSGAKLAGAELSGAKLIDTRLDGADLAGASLLWAYLAGGQLSGANLTDAHLGGADLASAQLSGAKLTRAQFSGANLTGARLGGADLTGANLSRANLAGANLGGADLTGAQLLWANIAGADLGEAKLTDTRFGGANLTSANLGGADLTGADLGEAKLINTRFSGANLTGAWLNRADLAGADLSGADLATVKNLTQQQLDSARGNDRAKLPAGRQRPAHWSPAAPPAGAAGGSPEQGPTSTGG